MESHVIFAFLFLKKKNNTFDRLKPILISFRQLISVLIKWSLDRSKLQRYFKQMLSFNLKSETVFY